MAVNASVSRGDVGGKREIWRVKFLLGMIDFRYKLIN